MEAYTSIRMNTLQLLIVTWMNLTKMMVSQTQKYIDLMIPLTSFKNKENSSRQLQVNTAGRGGGKVPGRGHRGFCNTGHILTPALVLAHRFVWFVDMHCIVHTICTFHTPLGIKSFKMY